MYGLGADGIPVTKLPCELSASYLGLTNATGNGQICPEVRHRRVEAAAPDPIRDQRIIAGMRVASLRVVGILSLIRGSSGLRDMAGDREAGRAVLLGMTRSRTLQPTLRGDQTCRQPTFLYTDDRQTVDPASKAA